MASVTETAWVSSRVPVDLLDRLKAIAEAEERTVSFVVRKALKAYAEEREMAKAS